MAATIGFFFGPIGIVLGPFLGAVLLELTTGRQWCDSTKAGLGAVLGLIFGAVGKIACAVAMIRLFAADVLYRALMSVSG